MPKARSAGERRTVADQLRPKVPKLAAILDEADKTANGLPWTFGGGTVLQFAHRADHAAGAEQVGGLAQPVAQHLVAVVGVLVWVATAPPMLPGMPQRNSRPAIPASRALSATLRSSMATPQRTWPSRAVFS